MKKRYNTLLRWAGFVTPALLVVLLIDVQFFYLRHFDAPFQSVASSTDQVVLERGEYLVYGPARCADCHGDVAQRDEIAAGKIVPLSGGFFEDIFLGQIVFPNITTDKETGIGRLTDDEIVRFFRTGINHRGEYGLPFMNYQRLSNSDLTAIISYLRSQAPVKRKLPSSKYNFLGKLALAYFIRPEQTEPVFPDSIALEPTIEYGRYLAEGMGSCRECHTNRSLKTGEYLGDFYAGGMPFEHPDRPELSVVSPNLLPDPVTGKVAGFSKHEFVERMQAGLLLHWSPMAWGPYSRMTATDLEAIYLYLTSLNSPSN